MVLSAPIVTWILPVSTEAVKGPSVERRWDDVRGETSERLPEDEVCYTTVQNCH